MLARPASIAIVKKHVIFSKQFLKKKIVASNPKLQPIIRNFLKAIFQITFYQADLIGSLVLYNPTPTKKLYDKN